MMNLYTPGERSQVVCSKDQHIKCFADSMNLDPDQDIHLGSSSFEDYVNYEMPR